MRAVICFVCEVQTLVFWSEVEMREIEGSNLHEISCAALPPLHLQSIPCHTFVHSSAPPYTGLFYMHIAFNPTPPLPSSATLAPSTSPPSAVSIPLRGHSLSAPSPPPAAASAAAVLTVLLRQSRRQWRRRSLWRGETVLPLRVHVFRAPSEGRAASRLGLLGGHPLLGERGGDIW